MRAASLTCYSRVPYHNLAECVHPVLAVQAARATGQGMMTLGDPGGPRYLAGSRGVWRGSHRRPMAKQNDTRRGDHLHRAGRGD